MKKVSLARASRPLAQYASELRNDIVVVTKGQRAVAALVPLRNVDRESLALSAHPEFMKLVKRARAECAAGKTVSFEEMRARVRRMRSPNKRLQPARPTPRTHRARRRARG